MLTNAQDNILLHVVVDADIRMAEDGATGAVEEFERSPVGSWVADEPLKYLGIPDSQSGEAITLYSTTPVRPAHS